MLGVGNTHEDIDALFGVIRRYLVRTGARWRNLDEFKAHVRAALRGYAGHIIIEVVTDTLDFKDWLTPCLNNNLALFSRHDDNLHPGMHVMRYVAFDIVQRCVVPSC